MDTYGQFAPTGFDHAGAFLPDRQTWLVAPVSQTRDSGPLDQSNFEQCLAALGGESDTVEVHRFGHWGPGWFEIVLIDAADAARVAEGESIEAALSDYPVIDDEDYSRREWELVCETWERMGLRERIRVLDRYAPEVSYFAARRDELPRDNGRLFDYLRTP